jgi:hypothetical protein
LISLLPLSFDAIFIAATLLIRRHITPFRLRFHVFIHITLILAIIVDIFFPYAADDAAIGHYYAIIFDAPLLLPLYAISLLIT